MPQVDQLVQIMGTGDYSIKELTEMCGFYDSKHFREVYIKPAIEDGAIERLFSNQSNPPKAKISLDRKGKGMEIQ